MLLLLLSLSLMLFSTISAEGPCDPDPCGPNSYCVAKGPSLIACVCLPGFRGTGFDGCYKNEAITLEDIEEDHPYTASVNLNKNLVKKEVPAPTATTSTTTLPPPLPTGRSRFRTQDGRPRVFPAVLNNRNRIVEPSPRGPTKPLVFGVDNDGQSVSSKPNSIRGSSGVDPEIPSRTTTTTTTTTTARTTTTTSSASAAISSPPSSTDLVNPNPRFFRNPFRRDPELKGRTKDIQEIFPEECLINEDCPQTDFCNQEKRSCQNACTLDICGPKALCSPALNRPVCYCPEGFEGNPYRECQKSPSRVGLRFRRRK